MKLGIFDSGLGGLTVAQAIMQRWPGLDLVYVGDTAHTPWGDKSAYSIRNYVLGLCDYLLLKQNCQALIIACNTASAIMAEELDDYILHHKKRYDQEILIINVIDPVVNWLAQHGAPASLGLIATKQTIISGQYQKKLAANLPDVPVFALATPLLVPLIEEGWQEHAVMDLVLEQYLGQELRQLVTTRQAEQGKLAKNLLEPPAILDTIILGCTHYPLIKDQIIKTLAKLYPVTRTQPELCPTTELKAESAIKLIDSASILANSLHPSNYNSQNKAKRLFFLTDDSAAFKQKLINMYKFSDSNQFELNYCPIW